MANHWTKEEHILAFSLYCKTPFSKINASYPPVKELAMILGRTNGSVAMKLANFARLDPDLKAKNISRLTRGAKGEEEIWNEFQDNWDELALLVESLLSRYQDKSAKMEEVLEMPEGIDKETRTKTRINQDFFRTTILASYNSSCCITGSKEINLLIACHIIPWAQDSSYRTNPRNGLCMNIFHHKVFDMGLFTITPDYTIKVSPSILDSQDFLLKNLIAVYHNKKMILPHKFLPSENCLLFHNNNVFVK